MSNIHDFVTSGIGYLFINIINQQVEINLSIADNSHYVK
jgi:hypothetical protein